MNQFGFPPKLPERGCERLWMVAQEVTDLTSARYVKWVGAVHIKAFKPMLSDIATVLLCTRVPWHFHGSHLFFPSRVPKTKDTKDIKMCVSSLAGDWISPVFQHLLVTRVVILRCARLLQAHDLQERHSQAFPSPNQESQSSCGIKSVGRGCATMWFTQVTKLTRWKLREFTEN